MKWNDHSKDVPEGSHAFLGASTYHWLNYSDEKLKVVYRNHLAAKRGTELHAFAAECIRLHQYLPELPRTLNMYVNDSIELGMRPEQVLKYSKFCFGTTDAICLDKSGKLRIHDYKSGEIKASFKQLEIYASLFCLEYDVRPHDLDGIQLRIYQTNERLIEEPEVPDIVQVMDKIVAFDKILQELEGDLENGWI